MFWSGTSSTFVIELGSLVEETRSEFGVAGLLGESQGRGRLPEKIALARHSNFRVSFATPFKRSMSLSFTFPAQSKPPRVLLFSQGEAVAPQRGQAATNPSLCRANRHADLRSDLAMSATIERAKMRPARFLRSSSANWRRNAFLRETRCCIPAAVEDRQQNPIVQPRVGEPALIATLRRDSVQRCKFRMKTSA